MYDFKFIQISFPVLQQLQQNVRRIKLLQPNYLLLEIKENPQIKIRNLVNIIFTITTYKVHSVIIIYYWKTLFG